MTTKTSAERPNVVWRTLSSVKLTIALLIILALASVLGTFIPQGQGAAMEFAKGLSPTTMKILTSLDLFDIYHATWFRVIIALLALNIIVCSIDRFPGTWKKFTAKPRPDREKPFKNVSPEYSFGLQVSVEAAAQKVREVLSRKYGRVVEKVSGNAVHFYCHKGRYSHFGVYMVHLSVLIILVGALIGSFWGFEAFVNILEGEQVSFVHDRQNRKHIPLGFTIRCEDFNVEFYEDGTPKEYRSDLVFLEEGKVVLKKSLLVNHPIKFKGIMFYQASYGQVVGDKVTLKIIYKASNPIVTTKEAKIRQKIPLPSRDAYFQVLDIREDFMRMGPAVLISVEQDGEEEARFWIFWHAEAIKKRFPGIMEQFQKLNPSSFKPYTFILDEMEKVYYTGLQVNKDPGVPFVWAGFSLMIGGLFVAFFTSHRRIWVKVSRKQKGCQIMAAGMSNKNPVGLNRELTRLTHDLKEVFSEG